MRSLAGLGEGEAKARRPPRCHRDGSTQTSATAPPTVQPSIIASSVLVLIKRGNGKQGCRTMKRKKKKREELTLKSDAPLDAETTLVDGSDSAAAAVPPAFGSPSLTAEPTPEQIDAAWREDRRARGRRFAPPV